MVGQRGLVGMAGRERRREDAGGAPYSNPNGPPGREQEVRCRAGSSPGTSAATQVDRPSQEDDGCRTEIIGLRPHFRGCVPIFFAYFPPTHCQIPLLFLRDLWNRLDNKLACWKLLVKQGALTEKWADIEAHVVLEREKGLYSKWVAPQDCEAISDFRGPRPGEAHNVESSEA